jgi:hypothetical protein
MRMCQPPVVVPPLQRGVLATQRRGWRLAEVQAHRAVEVDQSISNCQGRVWGQHRRAVQSLWSPAQLRFEGMAES